MYFQQLYQPFKRPVLKSVCLLIVTLSMGTTYVACIGSSSKQKKSQELMDSFNKINDELKRLNSDSLYTDTIRNIKSNLGYREGDSIR